MEVVKMEIERTARNLAILKSCYKDGHHEHAYNEALGLIGPMLLGCRGGEPLLRVQRLAEARFCKYNSNAVVTYDDGSTVIVRASKAFEALHSVFSDPRSYENFGEKLARALEA